MSNKNLDWEELGRSVEAVVDRAVNSHDYHKLNQSVRQVVDQAVDLGADAIRGAVRTGPSGVGARRTGPNIPNVRYSAPAQKQEEALPALYRKTGGRQATELVKAILGGSLSSVFGLMSIGGAVLTLAGKSVISLAVSLGLLAASLGLTFSGISGFAMLRRFHTYCKTLGDKTHCKIQKLARAVGKEEPFVRKELQKMIRKGLFIEGHLDHEGASLITSDETYRHYEQSRLQYQERKRLEEARLQSQPVSGDSRIREVLEKGNAFIAQIRACNDAIPGQEISAKIDRMEEIVTRIFDRARTEPSVVPDLNKLMNYYLPMTVKLLNAYADMDDLPNPGEAVESSMREIEQTLDTLNLAYGRLLDELFLDTAMDVSSDISVLNTLLAQEGLAGQDFKPTN